MSETVISVKNLSKRYRIGVEEKQYDTFAKQLFGWLTYPFKNFKNLVRLSRFTEKHDKSVFWALKDINFEVKKGEVLGIIGHNGAGKSTLLKILSRITEPTTGEIIIKGKVSSLLEVGTGFHSDLTGRENVYMNGTILGMTKKEIDQKFDEIVEFSGIKKYIDTPVKRYSSGMKVRLAFSVAAHLEPEILIIDEVLAVGDVEFQKKCLGKMEDVAGQGRTVLFVSHNMAAIQNLCHKGIVLKQGKIIHQGSAESSIKKYIQNVSGATSNVSLIDRKDREGSGDLLFTDINFSNSATTDDGPNVIISGETAFIRLKTVSQKNISNITFIIVFRDRSDQTLFSVHTKLKKIKFDLNKGVNTIVCKIPNFPLMKGDYYVTIRSIIGGKNVKSGIISDHIERAADFNVTEGDFYGTGELLNPEKAGKFMVLHEWLKESL